ncbi:AAA family ATPase [Ectobacillus polymachus]|uniref:AAA family ATPase n=1 Tax=Ectobacillus polymachus TaxID=1508806 RepID=UPI003A8472D2
MKPIQLTMTAFGPYKQRETIDFTELGEHRLFSISGNTGSGKTTIFDAICYALYGEASGEERNDANMLRSHFADDDTYTNVTLSFEMHRKTYYIKRQMAHRKEGNKTATGGSVELYEVVENENIPCVDRFHVSDVNKKVEELMGLTKHQFSQIVMLPQGEFRKLLTSETENKEEILRRIFKTDRYKLIRELLDNKRKFLKSKLEGKIQERDMYFRHALSMPLREGSTLKELSQKDRANSFQMMEALKEEQTFFSEQLHVVMKEEELQTTLLRQKEKEHHDAQSLNELFSQLEQKENEYNDLMNRKSQMKQEEEQLIQGEKANQIIPFEDSWNDAIRVSEEINQACESIKKRKEQLEEAYKIAKSRYEEEKQKQSLRDQKKQEWIALNDLKSIVETLAERTTQLAATSCQVKTISESLDTNKQQYEHDIQERKKLSSYLQQLDEASQQYLTKQRELDGMREDSKLLMKYEKTYKEYELDQKLHRDAEQELNRETMAYDAIEKQWMSEQAGYLAAHLHAGEACPVCGSTVHPSKADSRSNSINESQMNEARKQKESIEKKYYQICEKWKISRKQCEELAEEAAQRGYDVAHFHLQFQELSDKGKKLAKEVKQLEENETKRRSMRAKEKELEEKLDKLSQKIKQLENDQYRLKLAEAEQKLSLEHDRNMLPHAITSYEEWNSLYEKAKLELERLEQSWSEAERLYQELHKDMIQVEADFASISREHERALKQKDEKYETFVLKLAEGGFQDAANYETSKRTPEQISSTKRKIQDYYSSVDSVKKQVEHLRDSLEGKEIIDITELAEEVTELQQLVRTLIEQRQNIKLAIEDVRKLQDNIVSIDEQIHDDENKYQEIVDLYEVVKGDNENRISFERYILIEYLEQIVHAANERLRKLSGGQFFLKRSERIEKRNRQSGLGLDVYDAYTGQTRDVKTLSGGEKFNASLCLALGMADIIQAYEGGISIETMFIDEGFGSLDEESLMKAIDTLIDLQKSGRIIGVISHVQELKQALPASLEVTKSKDGYSQTKFVIK